MNKFVLALLCAFGLSVPAFGQMTQVTATNLRIGSHTISTGTVCAVAVDSNENAITVAVSGGGLHGIGESCANISNGAITTAIDGGTYSLPDASLSGNAGFNYTFTVTDTSTGQSTSKKSFQLHKVPNVKGATWALDHYFPDTTTSTLPVFSFTTGSGAPSTPCAGKSFYQDNSTPSSPTLYSCGTDLSFHIVTGSGGGLAGVTSDGSVATATIPFVAKKVNGTVNTDSYGGIVPALASSDCASGCDAEVAANSSDATPPVMPSVDGQQLTDRRHGRYLRTVKNPSATPCTLSGGGDESADCTNLFINNTSNRNYVHNTYFKYAGHGYALGFSPNSPISNNAVGTVYSVNYDAWTRGIDQMWGGTENAHATADKAGGYWYLNTDGGALYGSDEGDVGGAFNVTENSSYIHATILTGGTTGSNLLTTHLTTGQNNFTDGGFLLDISKGGTVTGTIASTGTLDGQGIWNMTSASMPVSTAWGTLTTDSTAAANGQYQIAVSQTINVNLGASPASPGDFVTGSACLKNGYVEQVQITAAPPSVTGVQSITFLTRYGWKANATHLMQGGMCGQYLTNTAHATWRNAVMAIGSYSSTVVVPAACNHGVCDLSGGGVTPVAGVGDSITQYPGAEIIGTEGGLLNTVELAYNTTPWANADVIEGPHPSAVNITVLKAFGTQTTKGNTAGSQLFAEGWTGTNPSGSSGLNNTLLNINDGTPLLSFWRVSSQTSASITDFFRVDIPVGTALDFSGVPAAQAANVSIFQGRQTNNLISFLKYSPDGSYSFLKDTSSLATINAANVPTLGALGQIPIMATVNGNLVYSPVTLSGDATVDSTGVFTLKTTVNTSSGTCGDSTHFCIPITNGQGLVIGQSMVALPAALMFNVKDFSVIGNGTADDTTAIQTVINTVNTAGGGEVFFPAGVYKITAPLLLYPNVTIKGVNQRASIIKKTTNTVGTFGSVGAPGDSKTDNYNVDAIIEVVHPAEDYTYASQISDLQLWGAAANSNTYGIFAPRTAQTQINNVYMLNVVNGWYTYNSWLASISNTRINNTSYGFTWADDGSGNPTGDANTLSNTYVDGVVGDAGAFGNYHAYNFTLMQYSSLTNLAADTVNAANSDRAPVSGSTYLFNECAGVSVHGLGAEDIHGTVLAVYYSSMTIDGLTGNLWTQYTATSSGVGALAIGPNSNVVVSGSAFPAYTGTGNFYNYLVGSGSTLTALNSTFTTGGLTNNGAGTVNIIGPTTTLAGTVIPANSTLTKTICSGTLTLGTTAIASGTAATTVTAPCTGLLTTDNIQLDFNGSPLAVTGYAPSATGVLTVVKWPTVDTVNVSVENNTGNSVTPGSATMNYHVTR